MKKVILSLALIAGISTANMQATNMMNPQPSIEIAFEDDGFVDIKFEDLNEAVQNAVRGLINEYDLNALKFNAEKQLAKVEATNKEDQTQKVFYFDVEGNEVNLDEPAKEEEVEEEVMYNEEETPSVEGFFSANQDDGFVETKIEDLNEKVQAVVNALAETHTINYIGYNAEKELTKVKATNKEDESVQEIYFDNEGVQTLFNEPVEEVNQEEAEELL